MSDHDELETKAGHPPALKVGGKRIPNRTHKNSEEVSTAPDENEEEDELSKSPKQPQLVMWGEVRDQSKDYPTQAIQHMQNKPLPTNEPSNKPVKQNIQQPRK